MGILIKVLVTALTTVATVFLLILNIRANRISHKSIEEMKRAREEEFRPYVFLDFEFKDHELNLVLKNVGRTAAYNVKLELDQDFLVWTSLVSDEDYKFKHMAISTEIEMLPPEEDFREWLDVGFRFFNNNEVRHFTGRITYDNNSGRHFQFNVDIDLTPYAERAYITEKDMGDLVEALDRLRRDVDMKWR